MLFSFFLDKWVILLIPAVIAKIVNHNAKLVISLGIPTDEGNPEIKIQPLTAELKI